MIVLHVRHAVLHISLLYSSKQQRKMTNFQVLTITWPNNSESSFLSLCFKSLLTNLVPVVRRVGSAIHWINHYPWDNSIGFASVYPLDSDLSGP